MQNAEWFVGIDWAADAHEVCIVDRAGRIVDRGEVKHTADALHTWIDGLLTRAQGDPSRVVIGIEVPRGGWWNSVSSAGSPSTRSIRSRLIGSGIASRWRAQRMILGTRT